MLQVIGKKYNAPKLLVVIVLFLLFLVFVGVGVYLSYRIHDVYLAEMDLYEIKLYNYQHSISYENPAKPNEPIWKYFLYNGPAILVGLVSCDILYYSFGLEKHLEQDMIIYDDKKQTIGVYKDCSYKNIPVSSLTSIERKMVPGLFYTGRIFIPTIHKTSSIVFEYEKNGRKQSVTSEPIKDVDSVVASIELIRNRVKKTSNK